VAEREADLSSVINNGGTSVSLSIYWEIDLSTHPIYRSICRTKATRRAARLLLIGHVGGNTHVRHSRLDSVRSHRWRRGEAHHAGQRSRGIIVTMLLGIVGAVVGGWLGRALGFYGPNDPAGS
jgi:hypothetical protein